MTTPVYLITGDENRKKTPMRIRPLFSLQAVSTVFALALTSCNIWLGTMHIATQGEPESAMHRSLSHPVGDIAFGSRASFSASASSIASADWGDYNFTIGICALVKDQEAYLAEWLDYHLVAMNIANIYLYDNSDQFYLKRWYDNTRSHPLYKRVHVIHWSDVKFRQMVAYMHCIGKFGKHPTITDFDYSSESEGKPIGRVEIDPQSSDGHDYLALLDGDEFLVPKGNYKSLHAVINDYLAPFGGALVVNWMLFGSANRSIFSPVPVTKRFQYRDEEPDSVVKSIVKASHVQSIRSAHAVTLQPGTADSDLLVRTTLHRGAVHNSQFGAIGATDAKRPSSVLLIHHYRYLSEKEYEVKNCQRGHVSGFKACDRDRGKTYTSEQIQKMGKPPHLAMRPGNIFDDSAWKILTERVPKYRVFDDEVAWGDYT